MARQAALAFDAFQHRRFLAADVGAGAAAQMDRRVRVQFRGADFVQLGHQHLPDAGIFVAQVKVDRLGTDRPGREQHPLDHPVRVGFEVVPVLEGSGLTFVGIDRHQARFWIAAHDRPLAPGRKSGPAETAQSRIVQKRDYVFGLAFAL